MSEAGNDWCCTEESDEEGKKRRATVTAAGKKEGGGGETSVHSALRRSGFLLRNRRLYTQRQTERKETESHHSVLACVWLGGGGWFKATSVVGLIHSLILFQGPFEK